MGGTDSITDSSADGFPRAYGKYELLRRLGDGGMAEVFLARLPGVAGFQKTLVLKRILPHLARKKHFVDLFVAEASLAAEVRHRNAVQVFELGQVDGELYMAMEYVEGHDFRRLLRYASKEGLRIPPWFTVHVLCEVLEALNYAYELRDDDNNPRRVVHRDVTPSNIFISNQGEVKLGDFGVAKDDTRSSQTRAGQLKGKVAYMAPEQLYSRTIDQRTDLFAVGVVLWEGLAQRRLFGGRPDIEMMNSICNGPRPRLSEHMRDVPPELDAIVLKALQPNPEDRFISAPELQRALYFVLEQLRGRVSPTDVRDVQRGLTKEISVAEARLGGLARIRAGTGSNDSVKSFTGLSAGEDSSNKSAPPVLANPVYGDRGDSIAELNIDTDDLKAEAFQDLAADLGSPAGIPGARRPKKRSLSARGGVVVRGTADLPPPAARRPSGAYSHIPKAPTSEPPRLPPDALQPASAPPRRVASGRPVSSAPAAALTPTRGRPRATTAPSPSGGFLEAAPRRPSSMHGAAPVLQGQPVQAPVPVVMGSAPIPPAGAPPSNGGEFDMDALVQEAVESVRQEAPAGQKIEQSSLIAGLDSRRVVGETRHSSSERWAFVIDRGLYEGDFPFWLVDHEGATIGPCSYEQAFAIVMLEVRAGFGEKVKVGVKEGTYMPGRQMLELLGMSTLVRGEVNADGGVMDSEGRTPIRVFAEYTRHPFSGRLVLFRDRNVRADYREIEILGGEPTFVWAEEESLQYPSLLVQKRLLRAEAIAELAHHAVAERRPLESVVSRRLGTDLSRYRPMLMKERLTDLFTRGYASYSTRERVDIIHTDSFSPNLLQVALELTFRCVSREMMSGYLTARDDRKTRVSSDFDRMMAQLSLSPEILQAVNLLTKGKPLSRLLETYPELRRTLTTLMFFCLEAELMYTD